MTCFPRLCALLVAAIFLSAASDPVPIQAQELLYVDDNASGADDGSSWNDAYPNLQDALSAASDEDVIAVAAGTYYPDIGEGIPVDDREASFTITGAQDGLEVYGGYAGDESISLGNLKLDDRDFEVNETTLSGDVDGTPDNNNGNSYHVLYLDGRTATNISSDTRIDGFTVTSGNANGSSTENNAGGGGLFCDGAEEGNECSPTLANIVFINNRAEAGGAIYNYGDGGASSPTIINSTFTSNTTEGGFPGIGGAIVNDGSGGGNSSPLIRGSSFNGNRSESNGGAIHNDAFNGFISPKILNSSFDGNTSGGRGGAIYDEGGDGATPNLLVNMSTFNNNTASGAGGAIYSDGEPKVIRSSFTSNASSDDGGAVYSSNESEYLEIISVSFLGNTTDISGDEGRGGAIFVKENDNNSNILNSFFSGNTSSLSGGAIYIDNTNPNIINSSFSQNAAFESGGAIYNSEDFSGGSSPTITNSIFYDNSGAGNGDQIYNEGENSEPTVSYSLVEGGCSNISGNICGDGNLTGDPQFADADGPDDTPGTKDDDLRLQGPASEDGPSPAIDAGDNTALPDTLTEDVTGKMSRFYDVKEVEDTGNGSAPIVDIGAYESGGSPLPVEMVSLEAQVEGEKVHLSWQTASETNNSGFEIQRRRSDAGMTWKKVGFLESKATGGTTDKALSYRFADADLPFAAEEVTYRLRQIDLDGTASFTDAVTVERSVSELELRDAFPNPARGQATVRFAVPKRQDVTLQLYDVLGREVRTLVSKPVDGRHERQVDLSGLASGTYFLRLRAEGKTKTQKLIVVR